MFARDLHEAIIRAGFDPQAVPLVMKQGERILKFINVQMTMHEGKPAIQLNPENGGAAKPLAEAPPVSTPEPVVTHAETEKVGHRGRHRSSGE